MSAIGKLVKTLMVSYGNKNPLRNYYYKSFHKCIADALNKKGVKSYCTANIYNHFSSNHISNKERESIIELANNSIENTFDYLGSGPCKLDPINWGCDFISGFEWAPGLYYKKYKQVNLGDNADVKVPRELSRSHFLLHLALAYQFKRDSKYAQKAYDLILDWIDANPLMYSINWCCSMDVGIRAMNWVWAISYLQDHEVSEGTINKIHGSLYQHGWFIYHNLEGNIFGYNNNHYFSDIVGLLHIAVHFQHDKQGNEWFQYALKEFFRELRLQILPCGMLYEGSTHYNRLVLELIIPSITLLQRTGYNIPADIMGRFESMFDFTKQIIMPDGTFPIIADQDNGRGLPWGADDINDMRYLLSLGASVFNRADFKSLGNGYNIYCAVFGRSYNDFNSIPDETYLPESTYIRDAGFAVMRKENNYLIFNADNQGMYKDSGTTIYHTHSDWFSFVLAVKGVSFIVDPGTYVYSSDADKRNLFRSTSMHNTVTVDGMDQEEINPKTLWNMVRKGRVEVMKWVSNSTEDVIVCSHNGYERLENPVNHSRSIRFDKQSNIWQITDTINSSGKHHIESHFHLAEGVSIERKEAGFVLTIHNVQVLMTIDADHKVIPSIRNCQLSKSYGQIMDSKEIVIEADCSLTISVTFKTI